MNGMSNRRRACLLLIMTLITGGLPLSDAAAATCLGRIGPETSAVGRSGYDPFHSADLIDSFRISIRNTGSDPCSFALLFRSRTPEPRLAGQLTYRLVGPDQLPLLTGMPPPSAPALRSNRPIPPAADAQLTYQLVIPRGQYAPAGDVRDTIELELYATDETGRLVGPPLQTTTMICVYRVERIISANIKGADTKTTLSFGKLAQGQEKRVGIQVRSNAPYQLEIVSDNDGALALTPKIPGQGWSIPYSASLDGQSLDLSRTVSVTKPPTRPEQDASHMLKVTIGDTARKRAGHYEDIITVEIRAVGL